MAKSRENVAANRRLDEIVDFDWLDRYTNGDADLENELLDLFKIQAEAQIACLRSLLGSGEQETWHLASHTLKGAAKSIGVHAMSACAANLEEAGAAGETAELAAKVEELEDMLSQFCRALDRHSGNGLK